MRDDPEKYREKPIYGTDFSKPTSELIEDVRQAILNARNKLTDLEFGYPGLKRQMQDVGGALTLGISYLWHLAKEVSDHEVKRLELERGEHLMFAPRGIGSDNCPCCFVCGEGGGLMANIAAFVKSKEEGEKIVSWFDGRARLDWRPHEPDWIQIKVGTCKEHRRQLEELAKRTSRYKAICQLDIWEIVGTRVR